MSTRYSPPHANYKRYTTASRTYLELLKAETTAQALLQVVLDRLPGDDGPQGPCCRSGKDLLRLLRAGCSLVCKPSATILVLASTTPWQLGLTPSVFVSLQGNALLAHTASPFAVEGISITVCSACLPGWLVEPRPYVAALGVLAALPVLLEVLVGHHIVVLHHLGDVRPCSQPQRSGQFCEEALTTTETANGQATDRQRGASPGRLCQKQPPCPFSLCAQGFQGWVKAGF